MYKRILLQSIYSFIILSLLCGFVYPAVVTGISQVAMNNKANGSITNINNKDYCLNLGEDFKEEGHLWGRKQSVSIIEINGKLVAYGQAKNSNISSKDYNESIAKYAEFMKKANLQETSVPVDLITYSSSGLDPEISIEAAYYQTKRLATYYKVDESIIKQIIDNNSSKRFLNIFGENIVNVKKVNLELEKIK